MAGESREEGKGNAACRDQIEGWIDGGIDYAMNVDSRDRGTTLEDAISLLYRISRKGKGR